jgi:3-hydroxyacyl-CoA dehydrogenase
LADVVAVNKFERPGGAGAVRDAARQLKDTLAAVADSMYAEYKEPLYAAPPLLLRMTAAGLLGRKSGRGFYDYQER